MKNTANASDNHCNVREQRHLVSEMTKCDHSGNNHQEKLECYLKATKESRESNACMFA